jgi:hypothetical protein
MKIPKLNFVLDYAQKQGIECDIAKEWYNFICTSRISINNWRYALLWYNGKKKLDEKIQYEEKIMFKQVKEEFADAMLELKDNNLICRGSIMDEFEKAIRNLMEIKGRYK